MENSNILQFKELLNNYQLGGEKVNFDELIECLKSMDKQMNQVVKELGALKEELSHINDKTFKSTVNKTTEELEVIVNNAIEKSNEYKENLYNSIDAAIENVKIGGKEALTGCINTLHIQDALNVFKTLNQHIIKCCDNAIDKLTSLTNRAHEAKGHATNVVRAATGKEIINNGKHDFNNGTISKIQNYLFKMMESADNMIKKIDTTISKIDSFDKFTQLERQAHKGIKDRIEDSKQVQNQKSEEKQIDSINKDNLVNKDLSPTR